MLIMFGSRPHYKSVSRAYCAKQIAHIRMRGFIFGYSFFVSSSTNDFFQGLCKYVKEVKHQREIHVILRKSICQTLPLSLIVSRGRAVAILSSVVQLYSLEDTRQNSFYILFKLQLLKDKKSKKKSKQ